MDRASLRALALLAAALVLSMTTWFSATAVVPQLRAEWDLGNTAAAWLTIAVQVGFVAGALAGSALSVADVFPPRFVILAGALGAAAANLVLVAADGPEVGIAARVATGFFLAGVYPPALKLASTWFRRGRGTALGIVVGALTLGSAVPHLVNGLGGLDWQLVVWVTSVLTAAGGVLVFFGVPEGPYSFPSARFDPRQSGLVLRNRGVRLASLGYFGHMWELYAMWAWFLVFFAAVATDGKAAAYATFAVIGAGAVGCWVGGVLGDRWGRPETTAAMMAVSAACALAIGLVCGGFGRARARAGARLGLLGRRRLGAVLDARHGAGRAGVCRHRARVPDGGRVRAHRADDLVAAVSRGRGRLALGLRVPGARPGARDPRDAAAAAPSDRGPLNKVHPASAPPQS